MSRTRPSAGRIWKAGFYAALLAAVINAVWYLVTWSSGADYVVTPPGQSGTQTLPLSVLAGVSFGVIIVGTLGLWILSFARWGWIVWTVLVALIYFASLANPILAAKQSITIICLIVAHTIVAGAALVGPGRAARVV